MSTPREETVGTYEMMWDCSSCGQQGNLGKTHRYCPNCGAPQEENLRYFPSPDDRVPTDFRGSEPDWECEHCGTPNGSIASHCGGCGAPRGDATSDGDAGANHHCLAAGPDGKWVQVACNQSDAGVMTVCEREPVGQRSQSCGGPLCTTLSSTAGKKR